MATSSAYEQAQAELSGETQKLVYRYRMKWWRFKTWFLLLTSPALRSKWQWVFENDMHLLYARTRVVEGQVRPCFETMAGYYNDSVAEGFMTADEAERIYHGW